MEKTLSDIEHIILEEELAHRPKHQTHPVESAREYVKLAAVIAGILLLSIVITTLRGWGGNRFANDFMATFFITFAGFKFINIEEFALIYRTYDLISKELRPWPYAFPFIEAALGFGYFISTDAWQLNLITLLVTGTAGYGVLTALKQTPKFTSASLGAFIRLPLTKIGLIENGAMFAMAAIMLFS